MVTSLHFTHAPGSQNEGPDMLSRQPPVDEKSLVDNLLDRPTIENSYSGGPQMIGSSPWPLKPKGNSPPVNVSELKVWQQLDPKLQPLFETLTYDTPTRNTLWPANLDGRKRTGQSNIVSSGKWWKIRLGFMWNPTTFVRAPNSSTYNPKTKKCRMGCFHRTTRANPLSWSPLIAIVGGRKPIP